MYAIRSYYGHGPGRGTVVGEPAGVRDDGHVHCLAEVAGKGHAEIVGQLGDHLSGAGVGRADPVVGAELGVAQVMVDVDGLLQGPDRRGLGTDAGQVAAVERDDPRITSYNVCYTKLLRP